MLHKENGDPAAQVFGGVQWTELFPQSSCVETLTPNVIVFRDRAYKKVVKVKQGHKDVSLIL